MNATPMGIASPALAATPLPVGFDDSAIYLRQFLLNCQSAVKANDVKRRQLLKDALHAHIAETFREGIEAMIDEATDTLYEKLRCCEIPDEFEADELPPGELPSPEPD